MKDAIAKNFVANEHHSFTSVFTFGVVVGDLPTDRILTFLFPADVLPRRVGRVGRVAEICLSGGLGFLLHAFGTHHTCEPCL